LKSFATGRTKAFLTTNPLGGPSSLIIFKKPREREGEKEKGSPHLLQIMMGARYGHAAGIIANTTHISVRREGKKEGKKEEPPWGTPRRFRLTENLTALFLVQIPQKKKREGGKGRSPSIKQPLEGPPFADPGKATSVFQS